MIKNIIRIKNLTKDYSSNNYKLTILNKINFQLNNNDIISIVGPSGSGKSTFLNILGLLDSNYLGDYLFDSKDVMSMNDNEKNLIRNKSIGFVHQFFHLIPELSVWENVALPKIIKDNKKDEAFIVAKKIINKFGLSERINYKPLNLSGGEQQRVAIARALINNPQVILADEMTGNLDEETSDKIFNFFMKTIKKNNQSLIYVTHNIKYAKEANIRYKIFKKNICKL
tara:strand:+ start:260 stop:940 length:681 start_codon:yes stop_codon:yes gene_type:complete